MSLDTPSPRLPVELIEQVIQQTWALPLSSADRINFMTSSLLVNKTWLLMFLQVSMRDVHIPSARYVGRFLDLVRGYSEIFELDGFDSLRTRPRLLCRSLHMRIDNEDVHPPGPSADGVIRSEHDHPMANALFNLLNALCTLDDVPNLRHISLAYHNRLLDDPQDQWRFISFPKHVTSLELAYTFDERTPKWLVQGMRRSHSRSNEHPLTYSLHAVEDLTILGANVQMVMQTLSQCPQGKRLVTDVNISELKHLGNISVVRID